ncbi:MAG: glycosyltransferase family 9 protein [Burkholderiales bacterium]
MARRILFAIRSKLGDTLIAWQCVRAYADRHPEDSVTLLTRRDYARLFAAEPGMRVIGFGSRAGMLARLATMRLTECGFDILAVLWGSGPPIRRIGQMVRARRKIAWSARFAPDIFEAATLPADHQLVDPAACTIRVFEPGFAAPTRLRIGTLAALRRGATRAGAIGVVPIADEARRNLDAPTLEMLLAEARRRHPGASVKVFVNPRNAGVAELMRMPLPSDCSFAPFHDLAGLVGEYAGLAAWLGTDTGLYHLAVAMDIPATVFFGPTQPHKIIMPGQVNASVQRLAGLGDRHCEEKGCTRPLCLHANIAAWCGRDTQTRLDETPPACPLRSLPATALREVADLGPR